MRRFRSGVAIGLAFGAAAGFAAGWFAAGSADRRVADGDDGRTRDVSGPRPAVGSGAGGSPASGDEPGRRAERPDVPPSRARPVEATSPTTSARGPDLLPDVDAHAETKDLGTWPLERLLAALDADMKRTTFGPHAGYGAYMLVTQVRSRFPETVLPREMACTFGARPAHYPNAALLVCQTYDAPALAETIEGFARSGDVRHAVEIARLLAERDPGALAPIVSLWLGSGESRMRRLGVECWVHAPGVPPGPVLDLARRQWPDDPSFEPWFLQKLPWLLQSRPDLDPDQVESLVVAAVEVPALRRAAIQAIGDLRGRGHAVAIGLLRDGELDEEIRRPVFRAIVHGGRAAEAAAMELSAEDADALIEAVCDFDDEDDEALAGIHRGAIRSLAGLRPPEDTDLAASMFDLLRKEGLTDAVVRAATDPALRLGVRREALASLLEGERADPRAFETARAMLAAPGASIDLRRTVVLSLDVAPANRAEVRAIAESVAANDPSPVVRESARQVLENLAE